MCLPNKNEQITELIPSNTMNLVSTIAINNDNICDCECTSIAPLSPEDYFILHYNREGGIKYTITEDDDKVLIIDDNNLSVIANIDNQVSIRWLISGDDNFKNCEEALRRINYIKERLKKLEQEIFNLTLSQDLQK